ncbi:MAG: thioredoxin domain-containing protein [Bacteroidota bacterium]
MNKLQYETSPYLLQHRHNPVDWYAWKPEAFARAKAENKPILVSIGYSTCHWCHVMERESFENEDIAAYMNEHFINIKVDREERPDVDAIYMEACQIITGGGGWPLNCFLTPEGNPFYAGTYYPPKPAFNRPSWLQLLQHIANIWETQRDTAFEQAEKLIAHIKRNDDLFVATPNLSLQQGNAPFTPALLEEIFYKMRERFDRVDGGFGNAPKFPSTMAIQYLLNYHYFTGNTEAREHALLSLDKMTYGGIYDQLGGGFARYATDREWLIPHFEKMLYDNALLISVLSEAYKLSGQPQYKETVEETFAYLQREMNHPDGGFYSAQDADSEGVEGKFFVWQKAEVDAILGDDSELFCTFYDVTEKGNWEHQNILWRLESYEKFAEGIKMDLEALKAKLKTSREKLFAERSKRIYPGLDDKIILGWNALMATALAQAFTAFGDEHYRAAAVRNIDFILEKFATQANDEAGKASAKLKHVWKNNIAQYDAFVDDYAYLIAALIDLYQITFNFKYLQAAEKYTDYVLSYFEDKDTGLFFYTEEGQSDIVLRKKDLYDNATPSGNSTMVINLQRLSILLDKPAWKEKAHKMLLNMRDTIERYPLSFERWATALMQEVHPIQEIAVVGQNALSKALKIQALFVPNKVVAASELETMQVPLIADKTGSNDAYIYVCRDFVCQRPVVSLEEFREMIR